ncbi:TonB-dependent receptor [Flammeovirga agarivorans]|uniref:TonB-dependent receptor n=1 Tax=Flammeovirga agarivorans TaxID=2726742 RepID=A0A7X8XWH5_9BACT|nr:TonB-dependent receptor [Flammeovirga agarivorans]NLR92313.1 TonB-dependent receptor [Flammeovirga agarivorans]
MLQKSFFISVFFILSLNTLYAQDYNFRGVVLDESSEQPLEGVQIQVKEKVVLTDKSGRFSFTYNEEVVSIHVHFLGFQDLVINLKEGRNKKVFLTEIWEELDEVEIHEHGHDELSLSGLNISSINAYTLEAEKGTTIAETLAKTPGVSYISTGVGISKPTVRGMAGSRVIVSVDGIKLEDQQWGMDHGLSVGQSNVDEVEIAKGAATLKYGSDGLGGVIKMKSPEPLGVDGVEGKVGVNYKNNNQYISGDFKVNGQKDNFFFQFSGGYEDFGNYRVPSDNFAYLGYVFPLNDGILVNTGGTIGSFKTAFGWEGTRWVHSISYSMFDEVVGLFPGATGIPTSGWLDSFNDKRRPEVPKQDILHQMLTYNSHVDIWGGNIWFDIGYQNNNRKELSDPVRHGRPFGEDGFVANGLVLNTITSNIHFDKESDWINWETGISYEFQKNERSGFDFLIPNYQQNSIGAYGMFGIPLSEKSSIIGGVRYDHIFFTSEAYTDPFFQDPPNSGNPWQRVDDINNDYGAFSASLGYQWKMFKVIDANTNIAKTFRAPKANELASNGVHHGTFRHEEGNPDLSPEQGYQWDVNLGYGSKKVSVSLNPYFNYYTNYIYLTASGQPSPLPDAGQIYKYIEAEGFFWGYEFSFNWNITRGLKFNNSIEYVYSENTERGRSFSFIPPLATHNELTYTHTVISKFFTKPFISANVELVQAQNRVDINELPTDGYYVMGLKLGTGFSLNKFYGNLIFRVDNLTNNEYMRHLSRYRILNLAEPGRNFSVSISSWF